jgi:uncharacterized FlgJ-related protein
MLYKYCKKTLRYVSALQYFIKFVVLFSLLSASLAYYMGHNAGYTKGTKSLTDAEKAFIIKEEDKFSEEKLKNYLVELNVKFPHIVHAQAVIESGHFKSQIFKNNHNLFGMKQARSRATTNSGSELGHAVYYHWRESVLDYALYQCAFLSKIHTEESYYQYLKENYAESPTYASQVEHVAKKLKAGVY